MPEDDYAAHINQMERDRQAQTAEHEKQRLIEEARVQIAQAEARKARWFHIGASFGYLMLATTIIGICYIIWQGVAGPSADQILHQQDRLECIEHGGTYTYVNAAEDVLSCTMPGVSSK